MTRHQINVRLLQDCGIYSEEKITIKTNPGIWIGTHEPIVAPFSIHSKIYDGVAGDFKIQAFIENLKSHSHGKINILMCEGAHLNVLSLKHNNDISDTLKILRHETDLLCKRFKNVFKGCNILYWHDFIHKNKNYEADKKAITLFLDQNISYHPTFKSSIERILEADISNKYPDKENLIKNIRLDLIEMLVGIKIMHDEGSKFLFYPGSIAAIVHQLKSIFFEKLTFINTSIKM